MSGKTSSPNIIRGKIKLTSGGVTVLTNIGQYYKIGGVYADGDLSYFTLAADGTLTYSGPDCTPLLNGVSDVESDKAAVVTYALFLNGVLVSGAETPHTFVSASKIENISITEFPALTAGDYLNVYAKSDTIATTITPSSLIVTFYGVC